MTKKIAIHCPTEELWERVQKKAFREGFYWVGDNKEPKYLDWVKAEPSACILLGQNRDRLSMCQVGRSAWLLTEHNYTIIPAEEWLAEDKIVIGSSWRNRASRKVHAIIGVDERGWFRTDIGGLSPKKDFINHCDYLGKAQRELKVYDRVEYIGQGRNKGRKGIVKSRTDEYSAPYTKDYFLENYKLIHRGDEEEIILRYTTTSDSPVNGEISWVIMDELTEKQTNKKEKKMKRADVTIKEKMIIMDRDCGNTGEVISIHPETDQVVYKDLESKLVEIQDISSLYKPLVMPKPKPTKKSKKKGKGK